MRCRVNVRSDHTCCLSELSFPTVDTFGWSGALLVLKVEQHVLVKREVLLVPAVVFCGFFTQEPTFNSLFTRDHGQKERVSFIITHALLHLKAPIVTLSPLSSSSSHTAARDDDLKSNQKRVKEILDARNA